MSAANLPTVSRGFGHSAVKHIQQKKAAAAAPDVEGVGEYDVEFCAVSVSHSLQDACIASRMDKCCAQRCCAVVLCVISVLPDTTVHLVSLCHVLRVICVSASCAD